MKIPNPWPWHGMSQLELSNGTMSIISTRERELEVDDCDQVTLTPVKFAGRGGKVSKSGPSKIWSKKWGMLDPQDHEKKVQIEKDEAELKVKQKRDREKAKAKPETTAREVAKAVRKEIKRAKPKTETLELGDTLKLGDSTN